MAENIGVTVRLDSSDFDAENVRVYKLSGRDAIGQLFQYEVDLAVFGREGLSLDEVVGARVTLLFERDGVELCRRHGVVARVDDHLETEGDARTYRLVVVPSLHAATLRFRAIPADRTYRPPRRTPWPRIWGVVTGVVQPNAEASVEDYARLDEHGRYRVQFHFDTAPIGRPKPSRWVRMAQPHSGPNYGMHFPLKPGVEIACVFVDGDPDRPVIVATVPNPITRSPVTQTESRLNRLVTRSGVILEIDDGVA